MCWLLLTPRPCRYTWWESTHLIYKVYAEYFIKPCRILEAQSMRVLAYRMLRLRLGRWLGKFRSNGPSYMSGLYCTITALSSWLLSTRIEAHIIRRDSRVNLMKDLTYRTSGMDVAPCRCLPDISIDYVSRRHFSSNTSNNTVLITPGKRKRSFVLSLR